MLWFFSYLLFLILLLLLIVEYPIVDVKCDVINSIIFLFYICPTFQVVSNKGLYIWYIVSFLPFFPSIFPSFYLSVDFSFSLIFLLLMPCKFLMNLFMCVCVCVWEGVHVPWHKQEDQKTICVSWFSLSILCILVTELWSLGLVANTFTGKLSLQLLF